MENVELWWKDILVLRGEQYEKTKTIGKLQVDVDQSLKLIDKLKDQRFELEKEIHQLIGMIKVTDPDFKFTREI